MKNNPSVSTIGVVEHQSASYVRSVFSALTEGNAVVPLRHAQDDQRIAMANVSEIVEITPGGGNWYSPKLNVPATATTAYIAFTSGTEGDPKTVHLSGDALNNTIERLQQLMQMDASVKEYIGVPVYHSFGFGRCRHIASVGGSCYIPPNGFDPRELAQLMAEDKINALSLVPSLLRLLIQTPSLLEGSGSQLRWLEIGSQPMSLSEKQQVNALFPNAKIVQHYGLTEASRTTLLSLHDATEQQLGSVGRCYGETAIRINKQQRICIRGNHLAHDVFKGGRSIGVTDNEGWFATTDLGRIDDDGFLYFLGRADNVVNCGGQKLSTERVESALIQHELLEQHGGVVLAVSRMPHASYGEGFLVSYVSSGAAADEQIAVVIKTASEEVLTALGISAKNALSYQAVSCLPTTSTGKIQHAVLLERYQHSMRLANDHIASVEKNSASLEWMQFISGVADVLGVPVADMNTEQTVSDMGVDSLQTVQLSIKIESFLGELPPDWRDTRFSDWRHAAGNQKEMSDKPEPVAFSHANVADRKTASKAPPLWDGSSNRNPSGISFVELIKEDYRTHDRELFSQGLFALFVNRFGNWRMSIRSKLFRFPMTLVYRLLRKVAQVGCGIKLDYTVQVGRRVKLEHFGGMIIGARYIGDDTIIRQNTTLGIRDMSDLAAKPTIEQGVNIGAGAVIVGDIVVGRHSVIGPNCVVSENIPAFSVVSAPQPVITSVTSAND